MIFSVVSFVFVNTANAAVNWEPLVKIPGIPVTGVNLSTYLIGIYNFLLSIVGIVAVMMLIVGGMRYITAAGNSAAIADAKDIITNAIVGLLLALLTWVFIATINPDALYLKKPGSTFTTALPIGPDAGACYNNFVLPDVCTCADLVVITSSNVGDCLSDCRAQNHCIIPPGSCLAGGANDFLESNYDGICHCIDGTDVIPDPLWIASPPLDKELNCDFVCTTPDAAYGDYHGVNFAVKVGVDSNHLQIIPDSGFTVQKGIPIVFDFSQVEDCRYGTVHIAINYNGPPGVFPNQWCCRKNVLCLVGWGGACLLAPAGKDCDNIGQTHVPESLPLSPIYKHTYIASGTQQLWIGVSVDEPVANCLDIIKLYDTTIVDSWSG